MKIILTCHDKETLAAIRQKLEINGYEVLNPGSEADFQAIITDSEVVAAVLDFSDPVALACLKAGTLKQRQSEFPIIGLFSDEEFEQVSEDFSVTDYMIKPFEFSQLLRRIKWNLSRKRVKQAAEKAEPAKYDKKILIVDDDQDLSNVLKLRLEKEGFKVYQFFNGEDAVREIAKNLPDLILLDVMMSKLDGFSTLKQINQITERKVPVIMMTGTVVIPEEEFRIEGASGFLRKPIDGNVLAKEVKTLLGLSS